MRYLVLGVTLILAGCASSLDADLKSAQAKCTATGTMTVFVTCLNDADEQVWRKDSPQDAPGYTAFAAARLDLAKNLDSRKITETQFRDGVDQARVKFLALVAQNAGIRRQQDEQRRMQDMLQNIQKPVAPNGGMNNSMMDNEMGM